MSGGGGRHKQKVQISVHGAYRDPKEANTLNNISLKYGEWGARAPWTPKIRHCLYWLYLHIF